MSDRSRRFEIVRTQLDHAIELATTAAAQADPARASQLRAEARESLDSAIGILNGIEGICEVHLRPVRERVADAERRLESACDR